MLVIRKEQLDAFRDADWRSFLREIEAGARAVLAARGDARAELPLAERVQEAVALAKRHGFRGRPHLARFARFVVIAGEGWATPAALAALADSADDDARLARLETIAKE